jgi:hypothetical protein
VLAVIPVGEPAKPSQTKPFLQNGIGFVFLMSFTEQVLFGHSKNKTTRRLAGGL